jgi:hypothetical protein
LIKVCPFLIRPEDFLRISWNILNGFEWDTFKTHAPLNKQWILNGKNIKRQERPHKRKILKDESTGGDIDATEELENDHRKDMSRQSLSRKD